MCRTIVEFNCNGYNWWNLFLDRSELICFDYSESNNSVGDKCGFRDLYRNYYRQFLLCFRNDNACSEFRNFYGNHSCRTFLFEWGSSNTCFGKSGRKLVRNRYCEYNYRLV